MLFLLEHGYSGSKSLVIHTSNTAKYANRQMLDRLSLVDSVRNRQYLLDKTQHLVGGFGKGVGEPPDLLHSYFGLVSLAFDGESGLNSVDPTLCTTHRGVRHLHSLSWW